jgi:hypothetical protein
VLNIPKNPNNDDDGNGYTNIEDWLHDFSPDVAAERPRAPTNVLVK